MYTCIDDDNQQWNDYNWDFCAGVAYKQVVQNILPNIPSPLAGEGKGEGVVKSISHELFEAHKIF